MKKLSKLLLGLILSFMVIQVPLALNHSVYALDDETTEDVITPKSGLMYEDNQFVYYSDGEVNKDFKGLAEYEGEKYYVSPASNSLLFSFRVCFILQDKSNDKYQINQQVYKKAFQI